MRNQDDMAEQAFQMYYAMGGKRSQENVANKLKIPMHRVKQWSTALGWRSRISKLDNATQKRVDSATISDTARTRIRQIKSVRKAQAKIEKQMRTKHFGIGNTKDTVNAYKDLIAIDRLLTGETTENVGVTKTHEDALNELE